MNGLFFVVVFCFAFGIGSTFGLDQDSICSKLGFERHSIRIKEDTVNIFVYNPKREKIKKGLFFYVQGSGAEPLCYLDRNGKPSLNFSLHTYDQISDVYYFALISKPGIPFCTDERFVPPKVFFENYTLGRYVQRTVTALRHLSRLEYINPSKVVVTGFSEGADVAAGAVLKFGKAQRLVLLSPGTTSAYFDFLINTRKDILNKSIGYKEGQAKIDSVLRQVERISAAPQSEQLTWLGHTYKRWASFAKPLAEVLVELEVPILIISGSADRSAPIESSDYIRIEFARRNKKNLIVKEYENCDHLFRDRTSVPGKQISKKDLVAKDIINWIL